MKMSKRSELPYPGDELAYRVQGATGRESFHDSGKRSIGEIDKGLAAVGKTWESFKQILDFGCGCGRMLLWLEHLAGSAGLHGVDIDERAINWSKDNLNFASFQTNQPLPPLSYGDGFFDLVFNHSVFTHIDEDYQDAWLAELRRVTKPGGFLVLSVHGDHAFGLYQEFYGQNGGDAGALRDQMNRNGIVYVHDDPWTGGSFPDFYHSTYHATWYVFEHWGRYFNIRAYLPRGDLDFQDLVVLERPAGDLAPAPQRKQSPNVGNGPDTSSSPQEPDGPALERAARRLAAGPEISAPSRFGWAARTARQAVVRVLRNYLHYQRHLDAAMLDAIRETMPHPEFRMHSLITLREAVRRQGERINRLEQDLLRPHQDPPDSSTLHSHKT